jgi:hypothetical protein
VILFFDRVTYLSPIILKKGYYYMTMRRLLHVLAGTVTVAGTKKMFDDNEKQQKAYAEKPEEEKKAIRQAWLSSPECRFLADTNPYYKNDQRQNPNPDIDYSNTRRIR